MDNYIDHNIGYNIYGHNNGFYGNVIPSCPDKLYVKKGMSFRIYSDSELNIDTEFRARFFPFFK